jgi:hypothetical protein
VTLIVCWLVFPLVVAALSLGCGLVVERISGTHLPPELLLPLGYATMIVVALFPTMTGVTARLSVPLVVSLAAVGLLLGVTSRGPRIGSPGVVAAIATFLVYAAPIVFSGEATFGGYIKLDDTATYLAMTDRVMEHGPSATGLPPSTYEATLATTIAYGYPVGALLPIGIGHELVRQDSAWIWQPNLAILAGLLALTLYQICTPLVRSPVLRAAVAFVGAEAALLYGYALWGGVKELAAAMLVPLAAAFFPGVLRGGGRWRIGLPVAVSAAALVGVLSVGGAVWLVPLLLAGLLPSGRRKGSVARISAAIALTATLSIPSLVSAARWLPHATSFTSESEFGNLRGALKFVQILGIWPSGDFRRDPSDLAPVYVLAAIAALAALAGLSVAWSRRGSALLSYVAAALFGALFFRFAASPWVEAKALAIASPALLTAGLVTAAVLLSSSRRIEGSVLVVLIAGGVLWSNTLAYHDAWLAPRDRLVELERIGDRFAGQGPALMTEYEPYGVRHFLRALDAEGTSELRRRIIPLRSGQPLRPLGYADVDRFQPSALLVYRTLVLQRSPVESRPPSLYRLLWQGRYYDVWQRPEVFAPIVERVPLGDPLHPAAVPPCSRILRLAEEVGPDGTLVAAARRDPLILPLTALRYPESWDVDPATPGALYLASSGVAVGTIPLPPGRYFVWLGGTVLGRVELRIDDRMVGSARRRLNWPGGYELLGSVEVERPTRVRVELRYESGGLAPGSGGVPPWSAGPLVLSAGAGDRLDSIPAAGARSACGRSLDWVEGFSG